MTVRGMRLLEVKSRRRDVVRLALILGEGGEAEGGNKLLRFTFFL